MIIIIQNPKLRFSQSFALAVVMVKGLMKDDWHEKNDFRTKFHDKYYSLQGQFCLRKSFYRHHGQSNVA